VTAPIHCVNCNGFGAIWRMCDMDRWLSGVLRLSQLPRVLFLCNARRCIHLHNSCIR